VELVLVVDDALVDVELDVDDVLVVELVLVVDDALVDVELDVDDVLVVEEELELEEVLSDTAWYTLSRSDPPQYS
jgi:hypothetical protein